MWSYREVSIASTRVGAKKVISRGVCRDMVGCVMFSARLAGPSLWRPPLWLLSLSGIMMCVAVPRGDSPRCEPIALPMCQQGLPYNTTVMPNSFNHESQDEAALELHQFWPLVEINCSPVLRTFLCSIYLPVCGSQEPTVPPCRSLCHSSWEGCHKIMEMHGFRWPESLNCSRFPTATEGQCIGSNHHDSNTMIIYPTPDHLSDTTTMASQVDGTTTSPSPATLCEAITVPLCLGLSYDQTLLPNILQHQTQEQVAAEMLLLQAVIKTQCSPHLRLLLCSIFTPPCTLLEHERLPCRGLCLSVRHGCEGLMNQFGIQWPSSLECDMLPRESYEECVGNDVTSVDNRTLVINNEMPKSQTVYSSEASPISESNSGQSMCENITVPMCQNLPYTTVFPNIFNHTTQEHATLEIHQFWPLVEMECSAYLHLFLCSLYVPVCTVLEKFIPPCRSLCFSAKAGCEDSLETYRLTWPINCYKLPAGGLCVSDNIINSPGFSEEETETSLVPSVSQSSTDTPSVTHVQQSIREQCEYTIFPLCRIFYNTTLMPNVLHHRSQEEAIEDLRQFSPLVETQCSPDLQLFLCTIYVPPCIILERPLLPCRSLCLSIREGCEELLSKFGFQWPESLDCGIFPPEPRIKACVDSSFPSSLITDEVSTTYNTFSVLSTVTSTTITASNTADVITTQISAGRCEHITTPICQDIPYNTTVLPNLINHNNQEEAALELHQFFPLIEIQCSPDILLFLCSVYIPPCTILEQPLPPCRSLCLSARTGCEPLMVKFGFSWPDSLDCDKFPADPRDQVCLDSTSFKFVAKEESTTINSSLRHYNYTYNSFPNFDSKSDKDHKYHPNSNPRGTCEHIAVPLCQDIPYNTTVLPNMLNHSSQDDAGLELHQFFPLVKIQCSQDIQLFLCSVYLPPCTILEQPLLPCRSLCLSARTGCEPLMIKFGFSWPDSLDCDKFPADPRDQVCIDSVSFRSAVDERPTPTVDIKYL
ncbi:uncharacterized protein [Panulirus ornatus]|uniref:uncharacterized protein n=1 Tax=Panulirus ornatus TaxID=150431 RepID=UPI003A86A360